MEVEWKLNKNKNSVLKFADIGGGVDYWTFRKFFRDNFCYGDFNIIWQIYCLNGEVRLYAERGE